MFLFTMPIFRYLSSKPDDFEIQLKGHSKKLKVIAFHRMRVVLYYWSI